MGRFMEVLDPDAAGAEVSAVRQAFDRLSAAQARDPYPSAETRIDRLDRLMRMLVSHRDELTAAIDADFGSRSRHETLVADILTTMEAAKHARSRVRRWMKPRPVTPYWMLRPAGARIEYQPLGVVGIIGAWNYPVNLVLGPMVAAMAAGNRVLVKPSELVPRTSELLATMLRDTFTAEEVAVVLGGPDVARAVTALPLDHLLFTGSTRVGREVARAAAANLVPVTLELGGKSPVLIHPDYPLAHAAERIAVGKLFNAGQTCIAPDYVLLPRGREEAFAREFRAVVTRLYPDLARSSDYSDIATPAGFDRLTALLADAEAKGARLERILPGDGAIDQHARRLAPVLAWNATGDMRLMQEEIFGPILPVITVENVDEAIARVNAGPRPLALYYFDQDGARAAQVLRRTTSGGACINDTLLHFAQEELPFGGVGASGMGAYHGVHGFETFSHRKGVHVGSRWSPTPGLLAPPYGSLLDRAAAVLLGRGSRTPGR